MNRHEIKVLLLVIALVSVFLVASPALQPLFDFPQTEFFSEMWLLGPEHNAENYPYNVTLNENYVIFLGVGNQLGHPAQYLIQVKFRNLNQSAPDTFNHTSSSLPSLYNITAFVDDKQTLELPIVFSFNYIHSETRSEVYFNHMKFNDAILNLNKLPATWNPQNNGFVGNLFFELWIYNDATGNFQYSGQDTGLNLNFVV